MSAHAFVCLYQFMHVRSYMLYNMRMYPFLFDWEQDVIYGFLYTYLWVYGMSREKSKKLAAPWSSLVWKNSSSTDGSLTRATQSWFNRKTSSASTKPPQSAGGSKVVISPSNQLPSAANTSYHQSSVDSSANSNLLWKKQHKPRWRCDEGYAPNTSES